MGIFSTLLTVGGAIAGSFVGMPTLGASLGGAIGGAIDQSGASSTASKDQQAAQQQAMLLRQQAADKITGIQAPYTGLGASSVNALTGRLGLSQPATPAPVTVPAANGNALQPGSSVSAPAGVKTGASIDPAPGPDGGMANLSLSTAPSAAQTANTPAAVAPPVGSTNALTGAPSGSAPPLGTDPGTYGNTANPTEPTPGNFSYTAADYRASPGLQYQLDQARKATVAGSAATGALQSGAAMKELQDRAQNIAYQDFTNERAFDAGQFNTDRAFNQNVYTNDRDYLTNRFDTQTNNLFKGTAVGQQAAGVVSNADLNVANGNATSATAIGDAQAGNALQQGNISSGVVNNVAGQIAGAFNPPSNALQPFPVQSAPNYTLAPSPATSATFVNPLPQYSY